MLKQKILVQFGSNIGLKLLGAITGIIVARYAGPEVMGILAYGFAYVSIFAFVSGIWGTGHIKLISEGQALGKCMGTYGRLQFFSIIIFILLVLSWYLFQKHILNYQFESREMEIVIWIFILVKVVDIIIQALDTTYTAKLEQVKANLPKITRALLYNIGRIIIVVLGYKAIALVSWNLISGLMVIPLVVILFGRLPWSGWDKNLAKKYLHYAVPILLIVIVNILISQSDKLILQHYSNNKELGYYAAAFIIGGFILTIGGTIGQIFFPLFSKYISNNDWKSVNDKIFKYEEFVVLFILPFVVLITVIAKPIIILLLGEEYNPSVNPFSVLALATFFVIWAQPYSNVINGKGKFYYLALIKFVKLVVFVAVLFIFLAPEFLGLGALGLAFTQLVINMAEGLLFVIFAKRIGDIWFYKRNLISFFLITMIGVVSYFGIPWFNTFGWFWWIIFAPLFLFTVYGVLYMLGLFRKNNILQLIEIVNLKVLGKYIRSELKNK